jgi:hypothetical protein
MEDFIIKNWFFVYLLTMIANYLIYSFGDRWYALFGDFAVDVTTGRAVTWHHIIALINMVLSTCIFLLGIIKPEYKIQLVHQIFNIL